MPGQPCGILCLAYNPPVTTPDPVALAAATACTVAPDPSSPEFEAFREAVLTTQRITELRIRCTIGYNVERILTARNWTQEELMRGSPSGDKPTSARAAAWKVIHGRASLSVNRVAFFATRFGVPVSELFAQPPEDVLRAMMDEVLAGPSGVGDLE